MYQYKTIFLTSAEKAKEWLQDHMYSKSYYNQLKTAIKDFILHSIIILSIIAPLGLINTILQNYR